MTQQLQLQQYTACTKTFYTNFNFMLAQLRKFFRNKLSLCTKHLVLQQADAIITHV